MNSEAEVLWLWLHHLIAGETEPWELKCLAQSDMVIKWQNWGKGHVPSSSLSPYQVPCYHTLLPANTGGFLSSSAVKGRVWELRALRGSDFSFSHICLFPPLFISIRLSQMLTLWKVPLSPEGKQNWMTHPFFVIKLCQYQGLVTAHRVTWSAPFGAPVMSLLDWERAAPSLPESPEGWPQTTFPPVQSALTKELFSQCWDQGLQASKYTGHLIQNTQEVLCIERRTLVQKVWVLVPFGIDHLAVCQSFCIFAFTHHVCKIRDLKWTISKNLLWSKTGFLNFGTVAISWITLCCGDRSVHCRTFSSTPGLCPLNASSTHPPQVLITKNVSRHCQMSSGGQNMPFTNCWSKVM